MLRFGRRGSSCWGDVDVRFDLTWKLGLGRRRCSGWGDVEARVRATLMFELDDVDVRF